MQQVPHEHPLRAWFAGLVESSFQVDLGICDPSLIEYLTVLLTEFIHIERINMLQDGSGRSLDAVAEMLADAEAGPGQASVDRKRTVHRHIGDFSLFWIGVYPEQLRHLRRHAARDSLISYSRQGKRSYAIASRMSADDTTPSAALLRRLSEQFEDCVIGLRRVRDAWEHTGPADFEKFNRKLLG